MISGCAQFPKVDRPTAKSFLQESALEPEIIRGGAATGSLSSHAALGQIVRRRTFEDTLRPPLKTVKAVGWHQELLQGRQIRRHDVRQALTSEFGVSSPSRGGRCKGVSLPFVLFAKLGRRRQFVVPLNVRIKLAIRLAVTTAALSKRRSPCRVMAMPIVSQCGPARVHFHDSWCRQDMGN